MTTVVVQKPDEFVLNRCTKYLARDYLTVPPRHGYQPAASPVSAAIAEAWRFPFVEHSGGDPFLSSYASDEVTFVYFDPTRPVPGRVEVVGTFADLYERTPLGRVEDFPYFSVTIAVPKGELHTYKFIIDGQFVLDPINPQRTTLANGATWSRFFTGHCTIPLVFERWQWIVVERLAQHILPFRAESARRFLAIYYDRQVGKDQRLPTAHRFDEAVGVVNYIDKALAREEAHHLADYTICLGIIDRLLRQRNPYVDVADMPRAMFETLYDEMSRGDDGDVPGWDHDRYQRPRYFLETLRRQVAMGAFTHPRYGGNACGAGWSWLEDRYRGSDGNTLFDWRRHQAPPVGKSTEYYG